MTQLSQPNFQQLAQSLIEQLSRHTEQLARLEKTVAELQSQTVSLRTQISVNDANARARLHNSTVAFYTESIYPLRDPQNRLVDGFPATAMALKDLPDENTRDLLRAFGLDVDGDRITIRRRFRHFIGIEKDTGGWDDTVEEEGEEEEEEEKGGA